MDWWRTKREQLLSLAGAKSPIYVYDAHTLRELANSLLALSSIDRVFYAIKANDNENILRLFFDLNLGFECVSVGEIERIFGLFPQIDPKRVLFTPNFAPKSEYVHALDLNCHVTLDSVYPLQNWSELFSDKQIFLRLDPGQGKGHHSHVKTAGKQSKFGISSDDFEQVASLAKQHQITIAGLHAHAGSGINELNHWADVATFLIEATKHFPDAKVIDLGGGHGINCDLNKLNLSLLTIRQENSHVDFWIEPGRYLVATAGVLLAHVTQIKHKGDTHFIGLDAGMNSLIRPMLYGAYHPIVNLSRLSEVPTQKVHVVGPICESGDTLGYDRSFPETYENDVCLIANAGAYGHVMSSYYNRREPAAEVFSR